MTLSLRRAEVVRGFLRRRGVGAAIEVAGRGEEEPIDLTLLPPSARDDEALHHMLLRRVEIVR
jgi:outer membrane protein OmpA-like peptidoglycan-associated protein